MDPASATPHVPIAHGGIITDQIVNDILTDAAGSSPSDQYLVDGAYFRFAIAPLLHELLARRRAMMPAAPRPDKVLTLGCHA